jgi:hypothetical protein
MRPQRGSPAWARRASAQGPLAIRYRVAVEPAARSACARREAAPSCAGQWVPSLRMSAQEVDGERNECDDKNQAAHCPEDEGVQEPQDDQHDGQDQEQNIGRSSALLAD